MLSSYPNQTYIYCQEYSTIYDTPGPGDTLFQKSLLLFSTWREYFYSRGATFWAFFKNHDATLLNASILHQLTLKRPSDPKKNRRRNFPKPKTSNFGPILAYVQKKAHLAIPKPPAGAMIGPNLRKLQKQIPQDSLYC